MVKHMRLKDHTGRVGGHIKMMFSRMIHHSIKVLLLRTIMDALSPQNSTVEIANLCRIVGYARKRHIDQLKICFSEAIIFGKPQKPTKNRT